MASEKQLPILRRLGPCPIRFSKTATPSKQPALMHSPLQKRTCRASGRQSHRNVWPGDPGDTELHNRAGKAAQSNKPGLWPLT